MRETHRTHTEQQPRAEHSSRKRYKNKLRNWGSKQHLFKRKYTSVHTYLCVCLCVCVCVCKSSKYCRWRKVRTVRWCHSAGLRSVLQHAHTYTCTHTHSHWLLASCVLLLQDVTAGPSGGLYWRDRGGHQCTKHPHTHTHTHTHTENSCITNFWIIVEVSALMSVRNYICYYRCKLWWKQCHHNWQKYPQWSTGWLFPLSARSSSIFSVSDIDLLI